MLLIRVNSAENYPKPTGISPFFLFYHRKSEIECVRIE